MTNLNNKKVYFGTASIMRRVFAFAFDLLILNWIVFSSFQRLIHKIIDLPSSIQEAMVLVEGNSVLVEKFTLILFFMSLIAIIYFAVLQWRFSQTIGQMIMGVYVVDGKNKPRLWQCIVGNVFLFPFFPFFILWVLDPAYLLFTGQRLSEKIARTKVVQAYLIN